MITATINTDASFCPDTGAAGFAVWVSSSLGRTCISGPLAEATSSGEAEVQAIANALHILRTASAYQGKKFDTVWINTDCSEAIRRIEAGALKTKSDRYIVSSLKELDCKLVCRWVKGHHLNGSARSYVNDWCDQQSKKAMRSVRRKLQSN